MHELEVVSVRLASEQPLLSDVRITDAKVAVMAVRDMLKSYDREVAVVLNLDTKNRPINMNIVGIGAMNYVYVGVSELFKTAILSNAASIMFIHNHPSGDLTPSENDIILTDRLVRAGHLIGIPLQDSIILGKGNEYHSMRAEETVAFNLTPYIAEDESKISWKADNHIDYASGRRKVYMQCSVDIGDPDVGYFEPPNPFWKIPGQEHYRLITLDRGGNFVPYPNATTYYTTVSGVTEAITLCEEEGIRLSLASYSEIVADKDKKKMEWMQEQPEQKAPKGKPIRL